MEQSLKNTFINPLCLPDYPRMRRMGGAGGSSPFGDIPDGPFGMGPMIAKSLPPSHQRFQKTFGYNIAREQENELRSSADPIAWYEDGIWYIFATGSACWSSTDFLHWENHDTGAHYTAPAIEKFNGRYYLAGNSTDLYVADRPEGPYTSLGGFTWQGKPLEPRNDDVAFFVDEDNKFYLFWGMGPGIYGAQLDPENPACLLTEPKQLITFHPEHEFERMGEFNQDWSNGFPEGSWMIKQNGVYYLLYSVCGTEFDTYAMGCYKSTVSPLEGFELQQNNPVARKVDGLCRGVGHASVARGPRETLWLFYTVLIGVDQDLERRIGCDPMGIDENGDLYVAAFHETPQFVPGVLEHPELGNGTNLDNITARYGSWGSSHAPGRNAVYGNDNNIMTWWQPADEDNEPCFLVGLRADYYAYAARVLFKEVGLLPDEGQDGENTAKEDTSSVNGPLNGNGKKNVGAFQYRIEILNGDPYKDEWVTLIDRTANTEDFIFFYDVAEKPLLCQAARLVITGWPEGLRPGVIDFTLFGMSSAKPGAGEPVQAV